MRFAAQAFVLFLAAIVLMAPGQVSGQEVLASQWLAYVNREYRFAIDFPHEPRQEDISYAAGGGGPLPARVFSAERDGGHYSVTVVEQTESGAEAAIVASADIVRAKGTIRYDGEAILDGHIGREVNAIAPDGRQIMAAVYFHDGKLYIVEADVPGDAAPPIQFQQSVVIIDAEGNPVELEH